MFLILVDGWWVRAREGADVRFAVLRHLVEAVDAPAGCFPEREREVAPRKASAPLRSVHAEALNPSHPRGAGILSRCRVRLIHVRNVLYAWWLDPPSPPLSPQISREDRPRSTPSRCDRNCTVVLYPPHLSGDGCHGCRGDEGASATPGRPASRWIWSLGCFDLDGGGE